MQHEKEITERGWLMTEHGGYQKPDSMVYPTQPEQMIENTGEKEGNLIKGRVEG